jgi:hypothetical protein
MNFKRKLLNSAVLSVLAGSAAIPQMAGAVTPGVDGLGQVLIYPYYTVRNGTDTAFSVVNSTVFGKALKVRILEGKNSREVIDFNLYLSPNDVWSGVITQTADGGRLAVTDNSCTVPAIDADQGGPGFVDFRNFAYTGANADGEASDLDRTREGYIEIIEMGQVEDFFTMQQGSSTQTISFISAITHSSGVPADCGAVRKAWASGGIFNSSFGNELSSPSGGLFGSGTLINVGQGTDYSYDPVPLDFFTVEVNHTAPGSLAPGLDQAFGKWSFTVVQNEGPISSNWFNQVGVEDADPVSAVLMRTSVLNEFVTEPTLNAGTDWIVTFPTKKFYVRPDTDTDPDSADRNYDRPFSDDFRQGGACEGVALEEFNREEGTTTQDVDFSPPPPSGRNELCWEVNVITFNSTDVLGSELAANVGTSGVGPTGWLRLSFPLDAVPVASNQQFDSDGDLVRQMISDESDTYHGLPVIGFAVQKYVNGNVGGVLSNYGGSFIHKYQSEVDAGPLVP